jgi:hypothetical protein
VIKTEYISPLQYGKTKFTLMTRQTNEEDNCGEFKINSLHASEWAALRAFHKKIYISF